MKLIERTEGRQKAVEIQDLVSELIQFNGTILNRIYDLVNTRGNEQAILDEFGTSGVQALQAYASFQQAMDMVMPGRVPAAILTVFVPREDGSIEYIAPPENVI